MKMNLLGTCVMELYAFPLTPPTTRHMLGAPGSSSCLPCHPPPPSPSPHTSSLECELISPRQALAPFPQMFAQTTAASCKPGAEILVNCFEQGHKAFTVLHFHLQPPMVLHSWQVELFAANLRVLGRACSLREMLCPCLSPSHSFKCSVTVNLS